MFEGRYSTRAVADEIDLEIQLILWELIEQLKLGNKELDYLQVFQLSTVKINHHLYQKIIHKTEVPRMVDTYYYNLPNPINTTLWIVDNGDGNAVLMRPDEY